MNKNRIYRLLSISILVLISLTLLCNVFTGPSQPISKYSIENRSLNTYRDPKSNISYTNQPFDNHHDDIQKIESILEHINETLVLHYLEDVVSFGPRMTSTYGCKKTAEYIYQEFNHLGLEVRYQNWSAFGNKYYPHMFHSTNIEGILPGTDESNDDLILFNAHYDSIEISPGADDDGSGVAAVLAAASALSNFKFKHDIAFVCFSGEEIGLAGSKAYSTEAYEHHQKIIVEFNADMIGYANTQETADSFRMYGTQDINWFLDELENLSSSFGIQFNFLRRVLSEDSRGGSDYSSFTRYGYESVAFFEGQWTPYFHGQSDDLSHVNIDYLTKTTKMISMALAVIADRPVDYPFIHIVSPMKGKLYVGGQKLNNVVEKRDDQLRTIIVDEIWILAETNSEVPIEKVEFYYHGQLQETDTEPPYEWNLNKYSFSSHRIEVKAYDFNGRVASDWIDVWNINLRLHN